MDKSIKIVSGQCAIYITEDEKFGKPNINIINGRNGNIKEVMVVMEKMVALFDELDKIKQ